MRHLVIAALIVFVLAVPAFADYQEWITDGTMVNGTYTNRTDSVFELSETPYVYMSLPSVISNVKSTWWNSGDSWYYEGSGKGSNLTALFTLDWGNGAGQAPKTPGPWLAQADYSAPGSVGSKTLHFSFAPEPISAGLFLLGAAALFSSRKQEKKS